VASAVFEVCERYVRGQAALDPVWGTMRGVAGAAGASTDYGPEGIRARADLARATLAELDAVSPARAAGTGSATGGQAAPDGAAAEFLRGRLLAELAAVEIGEPLRALRAPFGLLATVRDSIDLMPKGDADDWAAVGRPAGRDPADAGVLAGRARPRPRPGLPPPAGRPSRPRCRPTGTPTAPPTPRSSPATATARSPDPGRRRPRRARRVRGHGRLAAPGLRAARGEADGVGPERHAVARRLVLGADLDPVESYEWAWAELHRIEDELAAEAERVAPGAGIEAATALLDETDVVDGAEAYRAWLQDQHDAAIERLDGVHFDIAPQLRTVDATLAIGSSSGSAYYTPPDEAFTRPGRTWWPLGDRDRFAVWASRPRSSTRACPATTCSSARPG
jgi:hypothetical protein